MKKIKKVLLATICTLGVTAVCQQRYSHDRVYVANQISNTVSVIDPSENIFLGEIRLGKPFPNILSPLYKGQVLVHGLRYSKEKKMLAVVSIGSNSITLISTENNQIIKTIYIGRSPHEPTFTNDSKQIWVSVRGEAYISIIDVDQMKEIRQISVADGPGMVAFSADGKLAYICSSFTPEVDIIDTRTYEIIKKINVTSPFSPNIFTSPDGKFVALTHKDVGKVTVIDTQSMEVIKIITTGAITNHVTFIAPNDKLLIAVSVGAENKVKFYDVLNDFSQFKSIDVGALPHGIWASADSKVLYVGLEYADKVQAIDLQTMKASSPIQIGQSPQALVYADNAVMDPKNKMALSALNDMAATQVIVLQSSEKNEKAVGRLSSRSIGLADLIEQQFNFLKPKTAYTLVFSKSTQAPFNSDFEINSFITDENGKYSGQSTGIIKSLSDNKIKEAYLHVILLENNTKKMILINN